MAEAHGMAPTEQLSRSWVDYVAGAAPRSPRGIEPEVAEADLRAGLLRQVFDAIAWDLIAAPVEALGWLLPSAERAPALREVAVARARLPLSKALDRARTEWDGLDSRWSMLEELARKLPEESLGPILEEAAQIEEDEHSKATVLAPLMPRVSGELRARAGEIAATIQDEGLEGMLSRPPRTVTVPAPDAASAVDALAAWSKVALDLPDRALAAKIAPAAVRFLATTAELYARSRGQAA